MGTLPAVPPGGPTRNRATSPNPTNTINVPTAFTSFLKITPSFRFIGPYSARPGSPNPDDALVGAFDEFLAGVVLVAFLPAHPTLPEESADEQAAGQQDTRTDQRENRGAARAGKQTPYGVGGAAEEPVAGTAPVRLPLP